MDRRLLHRIAIVGGALAVIGGAVLVLRVPETVEQTEAPPTVPPPQTSVQNFADASVVVPQPGERPRAPQRLDVRAGPHRLVIGWGPQRIGRPEPEGAAGYEVRWGQLRRLNHTRFVADPVIQLDGLDNDALYRIEVRTVDVFGQRSEPARGEGRPAAKDDDPTPYTFVDRFDGPVVPDPARWRLTGTGNCTKAAQGEGEDARRMVITGHCGDSDEAVALRSRTPIRLLDPRGAPGGELGRFTVRTDRPGQSGELTLDLVPGPVGLIGRAPEKSPAEATPGRAVVDDSLPPGSIRVRITGRPAGPATTVQVLVAPGTPVGRQVPVTAPPRPEIGVSVRWDVVLRTDGVQVHRDGVVVGGADVVPAFTEATALLGFAGGNGLHAAVDLIGFTGAPTAPPPLLPAPFVDFRREVVPPGERPQTSATGTRLSGVRGGQLRITLLPQVSLPPGSQFTVDIGGRQIPARLAVAGQPGLAGARLPMVADVPAEALVVGETGDAVAMLVHSVRGENGLPTQVLTAELELVGEDPVRVRRSSERPLPRVRPRLAEPAANLLDAAGNPVPALQPVPRGRLVLEVVLDAGAAQRISGAVAGLAGVEISVDSRLIAGISTDMDGPGVGGRWRIALNTREIAIGGHTIQVIAIGVDSTTDQAVAYTSFVLR